MKSKEPRAKVPTQLGRGAKRDTRGRYGSDTPASLRAAVDRVVKDVRGKIPMREHQRGRR